VVTAPEINVLNLEQLRCLQATVEGTPDEVLYAIELPRGLRIGELLGLRWSDVDWNKRELHVRKQAQKGQLTDLKTAGSGAYSGLDHGRNRVTARARTPLQAAPDPRWRALASAVGPGLPNRHWPPTPQR
jgi:integrase